MSHRTAAALPSDEELASRAQQGCAASFEELLRRFQVPVLHFLRHRGAAADAEDLVQDTFIRAYTKLDQYRQQWRFATWLFTIARRVSINHYHRGHRTVGADALQSAEAPTPGPVAAAVLRENRDYLWTTAKDILSEEEQTALWLHYVEEMPAREIAVVLSRSRVSVKTMLFRARKKLLPRLAELAPYEPNPCRPISPRSQPTSLCDGGGFYD